MPGSMKVEALTVRITVTDFSDGWDAIVREWDNADQYEFSSLESWLLDGGSLANVLVDRLTDEAGFSWESYDYDGDEFSVDIEVSDQENIERAKRQITELLSQSLAGMLGIEKFVLSRDDDMQFRMTAFLDNGDELDTYGLYDEDEDEDDEEEEDEQDEPTSEASENEFLVDLNLDKPLSKQLAAAAPVKSKTEVRLQAEEALAFLGRVFGVPTENEID